MRPKSPVQLVRGTNQNESSCHFPRPAPPPGLGGSLPRVPFALTIALPPIVRPVSSLPSFSSLTKPKCRDPDTDHATMSIGPPCGVARQVSSEALLLIKVFGGDSVFPQRVSLLFILR